MSKRKHKRRRKPKERARVTSATETPPEAPPRPPSMRDAIQVMFARGTIGQDERRAAEEIRRIWHAITGGLWARAQNMDGTRTGKSSADWPRGLEVAYLDRYKPWAAEMNQRALKTGTPWLSVVYDAVVDERTLSDIDATHRWQHGKAADYVREALGRYVEIARWRMAA